MAVRIVAFEDTTWRDPQAELPAEIAELVRRQYVPGKGKLLLAFDSETKEKIIGMAGLRKVNAVVGEVRNVVVYWGYQNRGIGRMLMEAVIEEARRAGIRGLRAEAPEAVPALVRFFEKAGWARSPAEVQQAGSVRFEMILPLPA